MYNSLIRRGGNNILRGRVGGAPFISDLDTWHKGIDDTTFNEIQVPGLDAAILPRVYVGDDSGYWLASMKLTGGESLILNFKIYMTDTSNSPNIFSCGAWQNTRKGIRFLIDAGGIFNMHFCDGVTRSIITWAGAITLGAWVEGNLTWSGVNGEDPILTINSTLKTINSGTGTSINWVGLSNDAFRYFNTVGVSGKFLNGNYVASVSYTSTSYIGSYTFGQSLDYLYDISSNGNHIAAAGITASNIDYLSGGSTYAAVNGYSLWQKAGSEDIQVPFDLTGSALVLTPGVDIPTGYTKTRDITGDIYRWNMADALIDFDPTASTNPLLDTFDRSNATIHNAFATATIYYDAANPYRWHITEISDPHIYSEFFNVGYKGRIFASIDLAIDINDFVLYKEELNYGTDKTGADEYRVMKYCGIEDFALLSEGVPILDENDYVIIT